MTIPADPSDLTGNPPDPAEDLAEDTTDYEVTAKFGDTTVALSPEFFRELKKRKDGV